MPLNDVWANRSEFISRVVTRFRLSMAQSTPEAWQLRRSIQPTTNVDDLLLKPIIKLASPITVSGTGNILVDTVPAGKRWRLVSFRVKVLTGTWTLTDLFYTDDASLAAWLVQGISGTVQFLIPATAIYLDPGWTLQFSCDTLGVAGTARAYYAVEEEDAF